MRAVDRADPREGTTMGRIGNGFMKLILRTPGLQRLLGGSLALLTLEGRRTGRTYTIPVSYDRQNAAVVVLTRRSRTWWRNLADIPRVRLRIAGQTMSGDAEVLLGTGASEIAAVTAFLTGRKLDAKAYGVSLGPDGVPAEADVEAILPGLVVIRITPRVDRLEVEGDDDGRWLEASSRR